MIYVTLPARQEGRIADLLDTLRDTTASIYLVPDVFIIDLIQSRADSIGSIPIVALCETPFHGVNALIKRSTDIVLGTLFLLIALPVMVLVAIGVKLTSKGPVIFKQRRYGLDGHEIVIYKFRSMTVMEDSGDIKQATKDDARITPLGRFLRRTSLDEFPQLINVLQGRMSLVGPRPHAIAHNEMYRQLIKGYMIRHKVTPGITGLAQIMGWRGETEDLAAMERRIHYDLEYLRNWSLAFDLEIIFRTVIYVLEIKAGLIKAGRFYPAVCREADTESSQLDQSIDTPIFFVGMPRSGTTILFEGRCAPSASRVAVQLQHRLSARSCSKCTSKNSR